MHFTLVIDDEGCHRRLMLAALHAAGHEVRLAADANAGLAAFRQRPADLVICELLLPGCPGLEAIAELRRTARNLPILAITGGGSTCPAAQLLVTAAAVGASCTLAKPFSTAMFLARVQEMMNGFDAGPQPARITSRLVSRLKV